MDLKWSMPSIFDERNVSLEESSYERTGPEKIPAFVFTVTLTVIGIIGNSHAIYIYLHRYCKQEKQQTSEKRNPYYVFALSLAFIDMTTCLVIPPLDNFYMSMDFTPLSNNMCKLVRYVQYVIQISSVLHIVLISIHCWRQVCYPQKSQINGTQSIKFCLSFVVIAAIASLPVVLLARNIAGDVDGKMGPHCVVGENNPDSLFLKVTMGIFAAAFVTCLIIIFTSYIALILFIWRSKNANAEKWKTTMTLIIITVFFVIAHIPYMILAVLTVANKDFKKNLSSAGIAAHRLFIRFPFLNNVVNPFIYGLRDIEFRNKVLEMYGCMKRTRPKNPTMP